MHETLKLVNKWNKINFLKHSSIKSARTLDLIYLFFDLVLGFLLSYFFDFYIFWVLPEPLALSSVCATAYHYCF